jgi:translation initiation factor 5B
MFSGKKKGKGKQKGKKVLQMSPEDLAVEDALLLPSQISSESNAASKGKAKKKGKKIQEEEDLDAILAELDGSATGPSVVPVETELPVSEEGVVLKTSPEVSGVEDALPMPSQVTLESSATSKGKQKKKAKKSGRTIQEEEDLDAILAELDGPPKGGAIAAPVEPEVPMQVEETSSIAVELSPATELAVPEAEEVAESAAAKKKKKKKEKEKEKVKAGMEEKTREEAAIDDKTQAVKQEEPKGKVVDKKVPKHVREMQERLARMKEAEEKRLREEEEKRLQEEEKQRRIEELERQKEEAKRKRKEREKEKILQKKKEGKLLTGKKKEEARRLALMREQYGFPAEGDATRAGDEVSGAPRKPKYETKKNRRPQGGPAVTDEVAANVLEAEAEEHEQVCWTLVLLSNLDFVHHLVIRYVT